MRDLSPTPPGGKFSLLRVSGVVVGAVLITLYFITPPGAVIGGFFDLVLGAAVLLLALVPNKPGKE